MHELIKEYKYILKENGLKGVDVCSDLDMKMSGYKGATRKGQDNPPSWVKAFVYAYRLGLIKGLKNG